MCCLAPNSPTRAVRTPPASTVTALAPDSSAAKKAASITGCSRARPSSSAARSSWRWWRWSRLVSRLQRGEELLGRDRLVEHLGDLAVGVEQHHRRQRGRAVALLGLVDDGIVVVRA